MNEEHHTHATQRQVEIRLIVLSQQETYLRDQITRYRNRAKLLIEIHNGFVAGDIRRLGKHASSRINLSAMRKTAKCELYDADLLEEELNRVIQEHNDLFDRRRHREYVVDDPTLSAGVDDLFLPVAAMQKVESPK